MRNIVRQSNSLTLPKKKSLETITMTSSEYYQQMRLLALAKRTEYDIKTASLNLTVVRGIYKKKALESIAGILRGAKLKPPTFAMTLTVQF
jgi:hypothetical protein